EAPEDRPQVRPQPGPTQSPPAPARDLDDPPRADHDDRGQGEGDARGRRKIGHHRPRRQRFPPAARAVADRSPAGGGEAVQRDRAALRVHAGWLHADLQARPAPRRRRADGADRVCRL
ncbi:MAG: LSU ribosomal protein L17p, partial [uncultured Thermomicrobiales bacterium]